MKAVGMSDIGRCRQNNEDAYYMADDDFPVPYCYVVADGMGGCNAGEVASQTAIAAFVSYVQAQQSKGDIPDLLTTAFQAANQAVFDKSNTSLEFAEMGTTMVAAIVQDNKAYIAHVGDSRAYLLQDGTLQCLTTDHSYVMELVKMGDITKEEAAKHPKRNIITRAIGIRDLVETDVTIYDVKKGDLLLLCTDGLSGMLSDAEMETFLQQKISLNKKVKGLVDTANQKGGFDNISLVLIEI